MARFQTYAPSYRSNAAEAPVIRRWLFRALIASLILHAGLYIWFRSTRLERFTPVPERLVPRLFNVKTVQVDPKLLNGEDDQPKAQPQKTPIKPIDLPQEAPSDDKVTNDTRMSPMTPSDLARPISIPTDKPRVEPNAAQNLTELKDNAASVLEKEMASYKDQLLKDKVPTKSSQAMIRISDEATRSGTAGGATADAEGMAAAGQQLDRILKGGLGKNEKPLQLPGGALFEFEKHDLKPEARVQLSKLGQLIKNNPRVTFRIEGYSDSIGGTEYNQQLSEDRAKAVRDWLVENADVNPTRIETVGFGSSRFKVEPHPYDRSKQASLDAEIARQQPNRRVEIVFKFPKGE
jgi:outer membrane protein OmpA-like peptidoglycan-associated protein